MTMGRRAAAGVLLAAAMGLAVAGQFYFFRKRDYAWDGLVLHALAAACFLLAWRALRPAAVAARSARPAIVFGRWSIPAVLLTLGLLCTALATLLVGGRRWDQPTGDAVAPWLIGIAFAVAAALWPARPVRAALPHPTLPRLSRAAWIEVATVAALTMLAFMLRATALDRVPFTLGGDEGWHGLLARQVLHGQMRNPFVMGYMSMPTFFYWPVSWSLALVNDGIVGLRLPAALIGTLTVPLFYGMARAMWGRRTALISTAFLAAYDYHIHFSRLGANNIWDPLFAIVALWGLDRALAGAPAEGRLARRPLIVAGLAVGLGFYFYTGARLLPLLVIAYAGWLWLERRRAPESAPSPEAGASRRLPISAPLRALALVGVVAVIVAGPMLSFALTHSKDWNARLNQIGIIQSGWLAREPGLTGKTTAQILAEQFLRSAGAFHAFADRTVWYGADRPLLGLMAGVFMALGMVWAVAHWRDRRCFLPLMWFWAVILTGGMLTVDPPSSQRLVMAIPAACVLIAIGMEQVVGLFARLLDAPRLAENVMLGLLVASLALVSVRWYFYEFIPSGRYGSDNGRTATMIGHYLETMPPGTQIYFFGPPRMYWGFGTMGFLAPQVSAQDIVEPLVALPVFPRPENGRPTVFIFLPERSAELSWVEESYPGGQVRHVQTGDEPVRFVVYEVGINSR